MSLQDLMLNLKGGAGSGNHGHSGRPGKRGGSSGGGGSSSGEGSSSFQGQLENITSKASKLKGSTDYKEGVNQSINVIKKTTSLANAFAELAKGRDIAKRVLEKSPDFIKGVDDVGKLIKEEG